VDSSTIIQIVAGIMFLAIFVLYMAFIAALFAALARCSIKSRTMAPGTVWFMLVPLVNLVWQFFVVFALADSLGNEFRARGITDVEPHPGRSIGIAMCVCACCGLVPFVNLLALPAHLVLLIVYWVKIAEFSRRLDIAPVMFGSPNNTSGF
jgi:hypothetical protein